jgi:hypothetical protein
VNLLDPDGYPTAAVLDQIQNWPAERGHHDLMDLVKTVWWMPDWGWHQDPPQDTEGGWRQTDYRVSTGGWSGNEDLVRALQANRVFWSCCWVSSRRGGHHEFSVKEQHI